MTEPWQKTKEETPKAYEAFSAYRELGPSRSMKGARIILGRPSGYDRLLEEWSSKYAWVARAAAFDEHMDEVISKRLESRRIRSAEKQADLAEKMQDKVLERIEATKKEDLTPGMVVTWAEASTKIGRLALGEPTEIKKQEVNGHLNIDPGETTRRILDDAENARLVCELTERLGSRKADPGAVRPEGEHGPGDEAKPVEIGEASRLP